MFSRSNSIKDLSISVTTSMLFLMFNKLELVNVTFFVPRVQGIASKTFYFIGIKDWNNLPDQIKSIRNILKFKSRTKEFLAKRAIAMENCEFKTFQVG